MKHPLKRLLPPFLLILAGVLAYSNSFDGVFIYDDIKSIVDNPHIRVLWPLSEAMSVPLWSSARTVDGRPLLSLTFALNHALLGPEPWGYHLVNLVIHIAAGLLLFGIVRRTLALPQFRERNAGSLSKNQSVTAAQAARGDARPPVLKQSRKFGGRASRRAGILGQSTGGGTWLALAVAAIWLVHPLQTESVTYIVQRAESLMGFFYLLTLYCAIRGFRAQPARGDARPPQKNQARGVTTGGRASPRAECGAEKRTSNTEYRISNIWYLTAILSCACGMGVKQTMFSAPLLVLLSDGLFISDSFGAALKKRWRFYATLCATWLIVFGIIIATWRESTIDFVKISPVRYLLTQPLVLLYYLRLAVWPDPLVLSYGSLIEDEWPRIVFPGLVIVGLLVVMFRSLWRRKWYAYPAAWFFLILAPTSSIAPLRQVIFEHRMYLSLAAVVTLAVLGGEHVIGRLCAAPRQRAVLGGGLGLAVVVLFVYLTRTRNADYHSELAMWRSDVTHRPDSVDARCALGDALKGEGRIAEALEHYRSALRIKPEYAQTHNNLGNALYALGRSQEAIEHYREALRLKPDYAEAHNNWGMALDAMGQRTEAMVHYEEAVRIDPGTAEAQLNLGNALQASGRTRDALGHYRQAVRAKPDYADAHNNLANALLLLGQPGEAATHYGEAVRIEPGHVDAHYGRGLALGALGEHKKAIGHFEQTLRLKPDHAGAQEQLRRAGERMREE